MKSFTVTKLKSMGFTLIELLVVIAIVAVLAGLAVPSFYQTKLNQQLASTSNDFYANMLQARNEALRLNRRVTVAPLSATASDWTSSGWQVYVDMDNDGAFSTGDTVITKTGAVVADIGVKGNNASTPAASFSFDSRGFLAGNAANRLVFTSSGTGRSKHIIVSVTGRTRSCDPSIVVGCETNN